MKNGTKMITRREFIAAAIAASFGLSSCKAEEQIVGTWVSDGDSLREIAESGKVTVVPQAWKEESRWEAFHPKDIEQCGIVYKLYALVLHLQKGGSADAEYWAVSGRVALAFNDKTEFESFIARGVFPENGKIQIWEKQ